MNNGRIIIRKTVDLYMDGAECQTYEVVAKDTRMNREVAMLSLTLEELEAYVNKLSSFVRKEKGGAR